MIRFLADLPVTFLRSEKIMQMEAFKPKSKSEFFNLCIVNVLDQKDFVWGAARDCPMHCGMFGSILGLYSLEANNNQVFSAPEVVRTKTVSRHCRLSPGDRTVPG